MIVAEEVETEIVDNPNTMRILAASMLVLLLSLPGRSWAQVAQNPLEVKLIVPISTPDGQRVIALDRYPRFHVQLSNRSSQDMRIWKDWNSWGFPNLFLELISGAGTVDIKRIPLRAIDGDFPDFWVLKPQESILLEVDMSTGEWKGFPDLYGETLAARLRAIYVSKQDMLAQEFGIWTGRVASDPVVVVFQ